MNLKKSNNGKTYPKRRSNAFALSQSKTLFMAKNLSRWTEQDVANLRAGINKNHGQLTTAKK